MRALALLILVAALAGCAAAPPNSALPWRDDAFEGGVEPAVGKETLFRLDTALVQQLQAPEVRALRPKQRLEKLPDRRRFEYAAGHSTPADETWRLRRGDCISLTVLTFAAARALGLDAVMQEVQVPAVYDRRGSLDYVNHHVNVLVQVGADRPVLSLARYDDVIIDFEPEFASTARGQPLSDEAVLARYYNNMGVEALARRDWGNAYTHLRAAARVQPGYAPTYTNLAALYIERGLPAEAEQWLRHSVAASERPEHPLRALHQLVLGQGREREAEALDQRLRAWQQDDPYYWVSEGVRHLRESHPREAVRALERAQALTSGFTDVHRYLALAYWRLGESTRAQQQLQVLATINSNDPMGAKLRRKFNTGGTP
jgi:tetratricopeptide (TPR) repeat protein